MALPGVVIRYSLQERGTSLQIKFSTSAVKGLNLSANHLIFNC